VSELDEARRGALLTAPIGRLLVTLSAPALAVTALHAAGVLVDVVFAGHLIGSEAIAALGVVHALNHVVFALEALVAVGAGTVLSVAIGERDAAARCQVLPAVGLLTTAVSLVIVGVGAMLAHPALGLLGLQGETLAMGWAYYRVYLAGSVLVVFAFASGALLQARGDLLRLTLHQAAGLGATVLATPLLIGPAGLGLAGAAGGTVAGAAVTAALNTVALLQASRGLRPLRAPSWQLLGRVLRVGQSGLLMQLSYFVQGALVFGMLARVGDGGDLAFMGATYRLVLVGVYLATGFARALQPIVGVNHGAGAPGRVARAFVLFNAGALAVMATPWLAIMAAPATVLRLLAPDLALSAAQAADFRVYFAIVPVLPFLLTTLTLYQSIGLAWQVTALGLVRLGVLFVPALVVLPRVFGVSGVYYALAWMDLALAALLLVHGLIVVRPRFTLRAAPAATAMEGSA